MRLLPAILLALISSPALQARPHIVVFLTDDLGGDDTSVYGSRDARTPNIERLAAMGMTFDRAFIASPACAPAGRR